MDVTTVESPGWWAQRLYTALRARRPFLDVYEAYYSGRPPLPQVPDQLEDEARRFLELCRANYMKLVVRAPLERLRIVGFRLADGEQADDNAWQIWQASKMDLRIKQAFTDALKFGCSYGMVGPAADGGLPQMTVESPYQCIAEKVPGGDTIEAALKVWVDDRRNLLMATLYLPGEVWKWQSARGAAVRNWVKRDGLPDDEPWPLPNPLRRVPVVELANLPELGVGGVSELDDVMPIQDRLNLTLVDRMLTQVYGAFPQRYGTNWPLGADEIIKNEDGTVTPNPKPVDIGRTRILRLPGDVKMNQFLPADLEPILAAKTSDVRDIASLRSIPVSYLLGDLVNVSAEAQQVAESGLISRATDMQTAFGEPIEDWVSMSRELAGNPPDTTIHTIWDDPQYRSIAQLTDAVVKQYAAGLITLRVAQERLGYGPQEIKAMAADLRAQQLQSAAAASLGQALSQPSAPVEPAVTN